MTLRGGAGGKQSFMDSEFQGSNSLTPEDSLGGYGDEMVVTLNKAKINGGTTLLILVGQKGSDGKRGIRSDTRVACPESSSAYGNGGKSKGLSFEDEFVFLKCVTGGGGGGATAIALMNPGTTSVATVDKFFQQEVLVVAGGGGGGKLMVCFDLPYTQGGDGNYPTGKDPDFPANIRSCLNNGYFGSCQDDLTIAKGCSQTNGGTGGHCGDNAASSGAKFVGGDGLNGGGGGGGWQGGGGGIKTPGAGGSSYIDKKSAKIKSNAPYNKYEDGSVTITYKYTTTE